MPRFRAFPAFFLGTLATFLLAAAPGPEAPGDPLAGAESFTLPNGLTVAMRRDAAHPVVAVQMLYRVGARNETIGITGIAHYVEHMLFRGTEHFGLADITGVIERSGGEWHGYTTLDCTTFFEAAPKDLLTTLLRLEAERMHAARMAPDEVDPERGAVFQEYRGYQLDPRSDLFDATTALLFQQHPYRNNTMGWESDLAGITHADLVDFYRRHYGPRNAVLAIQGDFDKASARAAVEEAFGSIPAAGDDTTVRTVEPALQGPRRLTLLRPGGTPAVQVSFLAPAPATPKEFATFLVLDAILGDAAGLSFYRHSGDLGTGAAAPSGTPLGRLVDTGLVEEAGASLVPTLYPYHFSLYASGFEAAKSASVEAALFDALAEAADAVTEADVEAARRRIAAADALETDSYVEKAHELAYWTAIGGLDRRTAVRRAVDAVTADEVKEAAAHLVPARAAVGLVLPVARGAAGATVPAVEERPKRTAPARHAVAGPAGGTKHAAREALTTLGLGGGSRAIVDARPADSTFVLKLAVAAPRGTTIAGADDLAHALLPIGATLDIASPGAGAAFAARDTLRVTVAGPASAFDETLGTILARGGLKLKTPKGAVDPESNSSPMRRGLALLDRAASGSAPAAFPGPFAVLVGPFDPAAVKDRLATLAGGLHPPAPAPASRRGASGALVAGRETSSIPDIPQGALLLAIPGDADAASQEAVAWILHHNYSGRLGVRAIAQLGLVYDMDSESVRRGAPLVWFGMGADPAALPKLEEAMLAELDRARADIGDEEIAAFKSYASGRLAVRRADPEQAARLWLDALLRGEDDAGPRRAADQAAKLTRKDVTAAAQRMLDPSRRHIVVIDRQAQAAPAR
ncbi:MAG TPA: insulinase family protein [Candidatus Polarisedimenticolia bacterium]|nr:insulinase family protein [Candidatus Polarisedimenticolia bacterium]